MFALNALSWFTYSDLGQALLSWVRSPQMGQTKLYSRFFTIPMEGLFNLSVITLSCLLSPVNKQIANGNGIEDPNLNFIFGAFWISSLIGRCAATRHVAQPMTWEFARRPQSWLVQFAPTSSSTEAPHLWLVDGSANYTRVELKGVNLYLN